MRPDDGDLAREGRDIAATNAMKKGGYDKGGSFRDSVKDMAGQKELMMQDTDVRSIDVMLQQIQQAEAAWKAEPNERGKLMRLVELLAKTELAEYENRAIELLEAAYEKTQQYSYRWRSHQLKMVQLNRMERTLRQQVAAAPKDENLIRDYQDFLKDRYTREAQMYEEAWQNYPTDMELRFKLADRYFLLGEYDKAIPIFQQARNDPKFRVAAAVGLGRAFLEAGFVDEACDTLKEQIEAYEIKSDAKFTEMSYWYARALEKKGDIQGAAKAYSGVAMASFNYRDVQARIKRLRPPAGGSAPPSEPPK